jgi:hypothetical protein
MIIAKYNLNNNLNDTSWNWYTLTATGATSATSKLYNWWYSFTWNVSDKLQTWTISWWTINDFSINVVVYPNAIPTWNNFWEIIWLFNSSNQYIAWMMIYQQKWYMTAWVWAWVFYQPSTPVPTANNKYLFWMTKISNTIYCYINGNYIWSSTWTYTAWTLSYIKVWYWYLNWIIDEIEVHNTALTNAEMKNKFLSLNWFI